MGLPVCRLSDMTLGHGCYAPQQVLQGSPTVFVEGLPATRVGDMVQPHCCSECHPSNTSTGSATVFVNMLPLVRLTDSVSCGSRIVTGAKTVGAG